MNSYLKTQSTSLKAEFNLKKKFDSLHTELQRCTSLTFDMAELVQLVFFNEFDIEKYLQEKLMLERKDMAFLKSMNPNRPLNEKVEQLRIKERKKLARLQSGGNRRDLGGDSNLGIRRGSNFERIMRRAPSLEDLGPVENYLHLIDPDLKEGDEPIVLDKAQQILSNLNKMEALNALMNECQVMLNMDRSQINGEYLERLLGDVRTLYETIERNNSNDPVLSVYSRIQSRWVF